jgi:hypothetical protein
MTKRREIFTAHLDDADSGAGRGRDLEKGKIWMRLIWRET